MIELLINLGSFLVLLALGYGFGRWAEKRHYQSILQREEQFSEILLISSRLPPSDITQAQTFLVSGCAVISVDYFKAVLAALRNIFGGRVTSYETLLDRARREAILRMKESAAAHDAQMIFNVKLETSSISKGARNAIGSVEVLAYGTAIAMQQQAVLKKGLENV